MVIGTDKVFDEGGGKLDKMFLFNGRNWTANFRQIKVLTFTEKIRLMNIEYVRYKKNIDTTKWIDKKNES